MVKIMNDIDQDPRVEQWLEMIEGAEATRKSYKTYIKVFCECIGKTPSELIEESIKETREGKLLSERQTVIYFTKFKKCLTEQGKAPKTYGTALSIIRSFYKSFDIQLSSNVGKIKKRLPLRENQNFLTKDDIKTLITNAPNLRMKAIILCMVTSGMAKNEIINLKKKDITYDNNGIGTVRVRRKKAQVDYVTFISPEATHALKSYFEERNRDTQLKGKGENDYVFVTYGEKLQTGQIKGSGRGGKLADQTFTNEFRKYGDVLGFGNGKGFFIKSRSHALRKFFASTLENSGMAKNKIDFMLGHTPSGNDLAYFQTDESKLKELYIKFLPYLTFEKEITIKSLDTEDAKRLDELAKENEAMKQKIADMEQQRKEDKTLNEDMIKAMIEARVKELLKKS